MKAQEAHIKAAFGAQVHKYILQKPQTRKLVPVISPCCTCVVMCIAGRQCEAAVSNCEGQLGGFLDAGAPPPTVPYPSPPFLHPHGEPPCLPLFFTLNGKAREFPARQGHKLRVDSELPFSSAGPLCWCKFFGFVCCAQLRVLCSVSTRLSWLLCNAMAFCAVHHLYLHIRLLRPRLLPLADIKCWLYAKGAA